MRFLIVFCSQRGLECRIGLKCRVGYKLIKSLSPIIIYFRTMLKPIGIILAVWVAFAALHPTKVLLRNLCPYLIGKLLRTADFYHDAEFAQLSLQELQQLTALPVVGSFFLEQKVRLLVKRREWRSVLEQCEKSAEGVLFERTRLLPLRAVAECATYQFAKCEETIGELQSVAPHLLQNISHLYNLFSSMRQEHKLQQNRKQGMAMAQI